MLTPRQRQYLKAQAHHLAPSVHIGKGGVTASLAAELDQMLESLELVKVRCNQNAPDDLKGAAARLQEQVPGLEVVWTIGRVILVFRPSADRPTRYPLPN